MCFCDLVGTWEQIAATHLHATPYGVPTAFPQVGTRKSLTLMDPWEAEKWPSIKLYSMPYVLSSPS